MLRAEQVRRMNNRFRSCEQTYYAIRNRLSSPSTMPDYQQQSLRSHVEELRECMTALLEIMREVQP